MLGRRGRVLVFGVEDEAHVVGLGAEWNRGGADRLTAWVSDWVRPSLEYTDEMVELDRNGVIALKVPSARMPPYGVDTTDRDIRCHLRRGGTTFPASPSDVQAFVRARSLSGGAVEIGVDRAAHRRRRGCYALSMRRRDRASARRLTRRPNFPLGPPHQRKAFIWRSVGLGRPPLAVVRNLPVQIECPSQYVLERHGSDRQLAFPRRRTQSLKLILPHQTVYDAA